MIRWIALLSTLVLAGCVTQREVVYRDVYRDGDYRDSRYSSETYYRDDDRYYDDGSYYAPASSGRGDYYYGSASVGYGYGYDYPSWYVDYPAYYSVFWPMYRSWYDPFSYSGYYYGVTYFPRNYLSIGFSSGWPRYSSWAYSPYRYSWADNYYDWRPWHSYHSGNRHYRSTPRYGSSRNEAERLSRMGDWRGAGGVRRDRGAYDRGNEGYDGGRYDGERSTAYGRYGTSRGGSRDADYGSRTAPRVDPGTRGFGVPSQDVRRTGLGSERQDPGTRGFGVPVEGRVRRGADSGGFTGSGGYGEAPRRAGSNAQREADRYAAPQPLREPAAGNYQRAPRGYDAGNADRGYTLPRQGSRRVAEGYDDMPSAAPREYSRPEPQPRRYEAPVRGYESGRGAVYSAPMPAGRGYSAPSEPRGGGYAAPVRGYDAGASAPAPAPRYSAPEPSPRFEREETRSESRGDRGGRSDSGVRRVGSNRDD